MKCVRRKPELRAIQFTWSKLSDLIAFTGSRRFSSESERDELSVNVGGSKWAHLKEGDWLVYENGVYHVFDDKLFHETFELAKE